MMAALRAGGKANPDGKGGGTGIGIACSIRPSDGAVSRQLTGGRRGLPPIYTLGINAAYHDSAACLVKDGVVVAAAEDERFTHVKHAKRPVPFSTWELPYHAIDYCLAEAGIIQLVLEETVLELARWLHGASGCDDLCMAGGVALNCVMNARLRDRGPFRRIWVQPAAGDAGTAMGAALWIDVRERGGDARPWQMDHAYLGPAYFASRLSTTQRLPFLPVELIRIPGLRLQRNIRPIIGRWRGAGTLHP
jgi:predicted NodU family carbamoyl transferase